MKKVTMLAVALAAALLSRAETTVIEAESFENWGGWVNDTQFMDQMGSPYLLAHGMGKPVADAKTTFVAKGGPDVVGNGGDTIHLNKAGEKIQAEVWLKTLFGVEPPSAD